MKNRVIEMVSFLDAIGVAQIITLIPFMTKELGVGAVGFGFITSLYGLSQIIGGLVLSSFLETKLSRKSILLVSSIGSGISYSLLLIRGNLLTLITSRMLVGLVKQTTTSCKALVMMSKDNNAPSRFSYLASVRHMGSFIGSAMQTYITMRHDISIAIILSIVIFAIESLMIAFLIEDTGHKLMPAKPTKPTTDIDTLKDQSKPFSTFRPIIRFHANIGTVTTPFYLKPLSQVYSWSISFALILYLIYLLFVDSLNKGFGAIKIVLLQEQFNVSPHEIGLVYILSNLIMFITEFIITPYFSNKRTSYHMVLLSLFLLMAGKACQMIITNFHQYVLFCVILNTIGEEMFSTTFVVILSKISSPQLISRCLSMYDITESVCRIIGPIFLGELCSRYKYYGCEFFLTVSFLVLSLLWIIMPVINKYDACIDNPIKDD